MDCGNIASLLLNILSRQQGHIVHPEDIRLPVSTVHVLYP
jgi:hypothetical protein